MKYLIFIVIFVKFVIANLEFTNATYLFVEQCPSTKSEWMERARAFMCSSDDTVYHCLKTDTDMLAETCVRSSVVRIPEDGCPYLNTETKTPFIHPNMKPCLYLIGCPKKGVQFYTNELYKYPSCIGINPTTSSRGQTTEVTHGITTVVKDEKPTLTVSSDVLSVLATRLPSTRRPKTVFVNQTIKSQTTMKDLSTAVSDKSIGLTFTQFLVGGAVIVVIVLLIIIPAVVITTRCRKQSSTLHVHNEDELPQYEPYSEIGELERGEIRGVSESSSDGSSYLHPVEGQKEKYYSYAYGDFVKRQRIETTSSEGERSYVEVISQEGIGVPENGSIVDDTGLISTKNDYEALKSVDEKPDLENKRIYQSLKASNSSKDIKLLTEEIPDTFSRTNFSSARKFKWNSL